MSNPELEETMKLAADCLMRMFEMASEDVYKGQAAIAGFERLFWEEVNELNEEKFKNSSSKSYWYEKVELISGEEVDVLYFSEVPPEDFVRPCCNPSSCCRG